MQLAKALIRLWVCAGWSEPLLVTHTTLLEISCHGSIVFLSLKIVFILANRADPDEMTPCLVPHFIWVFTVCQSTCLQVYRKKGEAADHDLHYSSL